MSMDEEDIGFSAEEQAQFDAMREGGALPPGNNIQSPEQLTPPEEPKPPESLSIEVDKLSPKPPPTPPTPEPDEDPEIETIKDATGKEVIDAKTGKPQKRVSFHKYQRAMARMGELEKQLATTAEERARIVGLCPLRTVIASGPLSMPLQPVQTDENLNAPPEKATA
jgi:hypothetical protein